MINQTEEVTTEKQALQILKVRKMDAMWEKAVKFMFDDIAEGRDRIDGLEEWIRSEDFLDFGN